ncbi:MAG: UDP-3-O-(3-hydroxymyristoyl)glucosamine N-acyltransferase [Acidobacteriota bacterium]|nr:UDP-3-O-(3-hydroxymyristoyl)glucosamine N-acyltransferase [Acidobacteriota bacterium]
MRPRGRERWTLGRLAGALGRSWRGDPDRVITGVADLAGAGEQDLAAVYDPRLSDRLPGSMAAAVIVPDDGTSGSGNLILSPCPKADFARAVELIRPAAALMPGIHPSAVVHPAARIAEDVEIGPLVVVAAGCRVGSGCRLGAGVVLLENVELGARVELHPRVVVYPGTVIGDDALVLAGAVLGAPGFGQAHDEQGRAVRVPHLGRVVVGAGAEVGANATIDRAVFGRTVIGARAKLDNLVQVGHNAEVGEDAMIAAQSGLSGSSRLGRGVRVGGQSGLADHVEVAEGAAVAAKTAVFHSVGRGEVVAGIPARPIAAWRRMMAVQARLPELWARVRRLVEARPPGKET